MKKTLSMSWLLLVSIIAVLFAGCNRKSPEPEVQDVILKMEAQGLKVIMNGNDVERTFSIVAAENVTKDVSVTVETDAKESEAVLENAVLTIKSGTNSVTGKIKFLAKAFPVGAPEVKIKLTAKSDAAEFEVNSVTYTVSGADKPLELPTATFHCDVTDVFVIDKQVKVPVTIKLDKVAEQYTAFTILFDTENTIEAGSWMDVSAPYIDEGEKEVTFNIVFDNTVFKPGVKGICHLKIVSDAAKIGEPSSIKLNVEGVEPNKATLSTDGLEVVVGAGDFEKTITVTLEKEAAADAEFEVVVESEEGGFEIVDKTIKIAKGQKTGTGVIKFLKSAYPIELMTGTATVSVTTSSEGVSAAEAGKLVLNIKGTGTAPVAYFQDAEEPVTVKVLQNGTLYNFIVQLSEPLDKDAIIHVTAESDLDGGYKDLSETVTVSKGSTKGFGTIFFPGDKYPYDTDKANVILKISSDDVIVLNSGSKLKFKVSGQIVNPTKEDMKYKVQSSYDIYVGSEGVTRHMIYVNPEVYGTKNTKVNTVYAEIRGGKEGVDYEWDGDMPAEIGIGQGYTYLYINIFPAAAGKTLELELMSDDATVSIENTTKLNVHFVEWLPVTRSAPKVKLGTAFEDYGLVFKKLRVAENAEYAFGFPRPDWVDYYDIQNFNVSVGANDIVMTLQVPKDSYYTSRANVAIYADFNNDGNFAGAGEKIYLAKVEGLSVNADKNVTITMNVPADAASEFPVRIGTIVSDDIATEFVDGYFLLPGMQNLIQIVDFKMIVR